MVDDLPLLAPGFYFGADERAGPGRFAGHAHREGTRKDFQDRRQNDLQLRSLRFDSIPANPVKCPLLLGANPGVDC